MASLHTVVELYDALLQPVFAANPILGFLGVHPERLTILDWLATVRLCVAMRQIRTAEHAKALSKKGANVTERSFTHSALTTLTVLFGGEVLAAPFLSQPPSFILSPSVAVIGTASQYLVDYLPSSLIPTPSLTTELPLSLLDAFSRAFLVCSAIPPVVLNNPSEAIRESPWALAVTSWLIANLGFTLCGTFSLFSPEGVKVQTPPELTPYGWTAADLWIPPVISVLFATLTQGGVYEEARSTIGQVLGFSSALSAILSVDGIDKSGAWDVKEARALAAILLAAIFSVRAVKNFYLYVEKR